MKRLAAAFALLCALVLAPRSAGAQPLPRTGPTELPAPAQEVDIDEHLGKALSRDLALTDQTGRHLVLGDLLDGQKPVILVLAYYRCPMLCGLVLRGVVDGMNQLRYTLGRDYRALTVSIDPRDTPAEAAAKRKNTLGALSLGSDGQREWPFLVGEAGPLARLADEVGFRYAYDARTDQYAHPAAAIVLTPDGRVSRYLYGVAPSGRDLRLALIEAGEGKTGSIIDRVIMTCYQYDPASRAYGPYVMGFLRLGALFVLATVAGTLVVLFRREWKRGAAGRAASEARPR
ncbi:Cytochrome oxidase biogenesis protein Sco1/SenC/PrrC [Minicystis rosea]|nr:Cytochrome oxidase biogenesis protein Sco1/SenC/PrrC [Minicystis rosea]